MFRVYDNVEKCWVSNNVYLTPNDELFKIKQLLFGMIKIPTALDSERYIYHRSINLRDKNGEEIYEGDYIQARVDKDKEEIGLVCYAHELSSYIILCVNNNIFYTLGSDVSSEILKIGNVFDGYEVVQDGEQTLQETKV